MLANLIMMKNTRWFTSNSEEGHIQEEKKTNLATGLKQEGRNKRSVSCPLCKRPYHLNDCEQFLNKTVT